MTPFERLWNADRERLWHYCLKLSRNTNDASDLLQDTAVKAMLGFSRFDGRATFHNWACSIAKNIATDGHRRRLKVPMLPLKDAEFFEGLEPSPLDSVISAELIAAILDEASPRECAMIQARFEGHAVEDLEAGTGRGASKSAFFRFTRKIRRMSCLSPIEERCSLASVGRRIKEGVGQ